MEGLDGGEHLAEELPGLLEGVGLQPAKETLAMLLVNAILGAVMVDQLLHGAQQLVLILGYSGGVVLPLEI